MFCGIGPRFADNVATPVGQTYLDFVHRAADEARAYAHRLLQDDRTALSLQPTARHPLGHEVWLTGRIWRRRRPGEQYPEEWERNHVRVRFPASAVQYHILPDANGIPRDLAFNTKVVDVPGRTAWNRALDRRGDVEYEIITQDAIRDFTVPGRSIYADRSRATVVPAAWHHPGEKRNHCSSVRMRFGIGSTPT